jgi:SAM-dependent methyltransferase
MAQPKQGEWAAQWSMMQDEERFLFDDWIWPSRLEDFRDKDVLEAGCGGGQHTALVAQVARSVTAVDLNTVEIARQRTLGYDNVRLVEADLAGMDLGRTFDIVFSIGVVHHTDDPDRTVRNLARHVAPGGRLVLWVYSQEGNALVRYLVEPLRRVLLTRLSRRSLLRLSRLITVALHLPVYTLYRLPLPFLPYYQYFGNFRRLGFARNTLNVFDKLNAPQVQLISRRRAQSWFDPDRFEEIHLSRYVGVSWRASGTRRRD